MVFENDFVKFSLFPNPLIKEKKIIRMKIRQIFFTNQNQQEKNCPT